ncbi:DUF2892 domain-containing protein [Betaproteobacteria bacterium SCN2]|jgi:hypothetical protein|nr:DUF2892 domain-containing protein [Betaproteobacteria bacterium SCN2]
MTANVGDTDRYIRIAAGCALIVWGLAGGPFWAVIAGALPLATALFRYCPAYSILGMNTCDTKKD